MPVGPTTSSSSGAAQQGLPHLQHQQGAGAPTPGSSSANSMPSSSSGPSSSRPGQLVIPRKWMLAWFAATRSSFSAASSRDLATWVWGLAKKGCVFRPQQQWMASWQVASFRQLGRASSQVGRWFVLGAHARLLAEGCATGLWCWRRGSIGRDIVRASGLLEASTHLCSRFYLASACSCHLLKAAEYVLTCARG